ncbi:pentatricopeptide repeat-containing protein 1, mitochondrial [Colossoma macropomum]|uniref:pentatricopeptide repeat-containing protein 1, mitochondrial n=1 Tax=Colossoma macropomum TaxID=42526 RepID=UPI001863FC6C|nr:pentatricopeptide repeat-containing protein 1, mitochondrial [Colossoma macropomum]
MLRAALRCGLTGAALRVSGSSVSPPLRVSGSSVSPPFLLSGSSVSPPLLLRRQLCTSTPSPAAPTQPGEEERFGDYCSDFSSRTSFRRASPEQQELSYQRAGEEEQQQEEEEKKIRSFRTRTGRRNTAYWYFLQCKRLIRENRLAEALQLFEADMLKGERLQPEEFNYSVLIGGCGRAGYVRKAFQLYNNMKKRGLEPSDATYTALFNACAQSPWKQSGLEQALKLRQELRRKNVLLNAITHHALLKTVALSGDLKACFQVLRDMLQSGQAITQETFQYLLMCCVEDKQQGFRLALQVWHQMLSAGIKPDLQNYNILLRAARDCGIGDPAVASALLLRGREESGPKVTAQRRRQRSKVREETPHSKPLDVDSFESRLLALPAHSSAPDTRSDGQSQSRDDTLDLSEAESLRRNDRNTQRVDETSNLTEQTQLLTLSSRNDLLSAPPTSTTQNSHLPNLLDPSTFRSDVVALGTVSTTSDRLALMGNLEGFLGKMANNGLKPTIKTITLLADVMEPSSQSIQSLISVAAESGVKLDVAFFNTLIRKAAKAGDLGGAKAVKVLMAERKLPANAQTFCGIALACSRQKDGLQLLSDMEACGIKPNVHVFSTLISQATRRLDYAYLHELLKQMHRLQVPPNEVIIQQLEFAAQYPPNYDQFKSKNTYLEKIDGFRGFYRQWLEFMPGEETPHPWDKYRLPEQDGVSSQNQSTNSNQSSETTQRTVQPSH